jgi:hypothetical protein
MTIALGVRFKLGYVNGHIKPLESTSSSYEARQWKDQLVMFWLLNSIKIILLKYSAT